MPVAISMHTFGGKICVAGNKVYNPPLKMPVGVTFKDDQNLIA
jgi:hypothetical protein